MARPLHEGVYDSKKMEGHYENRAHFPGHLYAPARLLWGGFGDIETVLNLLNNTSVIQKTILGHIE